MGFPSRSDTNRAVQSQKMARGLKFWIMEVEGLYSLSSENKGPDQLSGHREADLRLCFRICKKQVFSRHGSIMITMKVLNFGTPKMFAVYSNKVEKCVHYVQMISAAKN